MTEWIIVLSAIHCGGDFWMRAFELARHVGAQVPWIKRYLPEIRHSLREIGHYVRETAPVAHCVRLADGTADEGMRQMRACCSRAERAACSPGPNGAVPVPVLLEPALPALRDLRRLAREGRPTRHFGPAGP